MMFSTTKLSTALATLVSVFIACAADQAQPIQDPDPDLGEPTDSATAADGSLTASQVSCAAFVVTGDPTSSTGATWSYSSTDDGIRYVMTGALLKPRGAGPWPAVVLSHGKGGTAVNIARNIGTPMRSWGLTVITTNYSHGASSAGLLPLGANGASPENLQRAHKAFDLLRCVSGVDTTRVAAHGHSMGAFVTTGLLGAFPADFLVGSHTAGGIDDSGGEAAAPTSAQASKIRAPYQLHHGDQDTVVPLALEQALDRVLTSVGTPHQLRIHAGLAHANIASNTTVLAEVQAWYQGHGLIP